MNCPHCDRPITSLTMKGMNGSVPMGRTWNCVAYGCPLCKKIISVEVDPIAVKTDILNGVAELLGKPRR